MREALPPARPAPGTGRFTLLRRAITQAGVAGLVTVLVIGWFVHVRPTLLPLGVEALHPDLYGGWIPRAHPLGLLRSYDKLELLLAALSRTMTGPILACIVTVVLGGLWGTRAAYREDISDRLLGTSSILLDAIPRIVIYAMIGVYLRSAFPWVTILHATALFAFLQVPAVAVSIRNHLRSVVREGYVEGLVSLGFAPRTIMFRDLLLRECGPQLVTQYVARVTELVALETAVSYLFEQANGHTMGWLLRQIDSCELERSWYALLAIVSLAVFLMALSALARTWAEYARNRT